MKNLILTTLFIVSALSINAQYCLFFEFKAEEPEMVVSAMNEMKNSDWRKNIQATVSLFALLPNGTSESTHMIQLCFPDEAAFEQAFMSYGQSTEAQLIWDRKMRDFTVDVSQSLNTPAWWNGNDWNDDNVFMIYQMDVTNPAVYVENFQNFTTQMTEKLGMENSVGLGYPIVGKNKDYSHFVWMGAPDIKTALSNTKEMFSDPLFAEFSKSVAGIRTVVNTVMMVRVADY